ncbi:MAG: phosphopantothenoylcysteine decarboxylase [Planctomycetota bacterium]|nr:MAG: phosphopantothenoylcysteine decarboxylase [Planctomycetota bacterium]
MNFLVTAGPTREYFDTVRFISNPSSGKMGYAIARAAAYRGHKVTLVTGPVSIKPPKKVTVVPVVTAAEMARACKRAFVYADVAVMTAAVCDYRPKKRLRQKLEKQARGKRVELEPTEDIATSLGKRKRDRILVAFAMEDHDPYARAERKLKKKNCDLMVLNGPANVGWDEAVVELYTPKEGWGKPMRGTKAALARRLVKIIESMWAS